VSPARGSYRGKPASRPIVAHVRLDLPPSAVRLAGQGAVPRFASRSQRGPANPGWWYDRGFVYVAASQGEDTVEITVQR
jgi:hypothetical protein